MANRPSRLNAVVALLLSAACGGPLDAGMAPDLDAPVPAPARCRGDEGEPCTDAVGAAAPQAEQALSAGITFNAANGVISIVGGAGNDVASVAPSGVNVRVTLGATVRDFAAASVREVLFQGWDGADRFTNTTAVRCTLDGGNGDDRLEGGSGNDTIYGGMGRDTLLGRGGNDTIRAGGDDDLVWGGTGNDVLYGEGGADTLHGDADADRLYGNSGNDALLGDGGQDTIVAIGGGIDRVWGGTERDYLWLDGADTLNDAAADETSGGYVHRVGQFLAYRFAGQADIPVSMELNGGSLADPVPLEDGLDLADYSGNKLFPSTGPVMSDIIQGDTGDCYFVSLLAALARTSPEDVRNLVVELGDSTYAVRFFRDGVPQFVRVDGDLWVDPATNQPANSRVGTEGAVWVPVVEKAYAFFRTRAGTYDSIESGDSDPGQTAYDYLGMPYRYLSISDGLTPEAVIQWAAGGSQAGRVANTVRSTVLMFLYGIRAELTAGKAMVAGARSGVSNNTPLQVDDPATPANENTFRRGQHVYTVVSVQADANGIPTGLVLRNPYGQGADGQVVLTDFTRIWFCISRVGSATP